MRNPHRWRNIGLGFFASGLVATVAAFVLPDAVGNDAIRATLVIYFLVGIALVLGLVALLMPGNGR